MAILLLFLVEHCQAGYGFNSYPIARPMQQQEFPAPPLESPATLPPLMEMPQLGEGAQIPAAGTKETNSEMEEMVCPACPAMDCPHQELECPELICEGVKVKVEEEREDEATHHANLIKEEELMRMRLAKRQRRQLRVDSVVDLNNKCNDGRLKMIMMESITRNIVVSKVTIAERASLEIGGNFGVICTSGIFSYYVAARIFCEAARDGITCFSFRHDNFPESQKSLRKSDTSLMKTEEEMTERDMEVKPLEEPPTATVMYEMDMLGDRMFRTSTSANIDDMKGYGLYDAQTRLLLEENFEELIAELEKKQLAQKGQTI